MACDTTRAPRSRAPGETLGRAGRVVATRSVVLAAGLLLAMHATAAGPSNKRSGSVDPAALYQAYCSVCHGERGDGQSRARNSLNPPPLDFTDARQAPRLTRERMIVAVRDGVPGTAMVGWRTQLDDARIAAIVDHVRDRFVHGAARASGAVAIGPNAAMPDGLTGRADAGRRIYEANCTACHGVSGDGKGPRAYFIRPVPRDFTSEASRRAFDRRLIYHSIAHGKNGTEMPGWRTVLSAQQIADVSEYVYTHFVARVDGLAGRSR